MKARSSFGGGWRLALMVAGMAVLLSGCSLLNPCKPGKPGKPQAYNLHIKLDPALKDSSVVVDVLPANQYNLEKLKNYSMTKYWKKGDPLRQDTPKVTFSFVSSDKLEQNLPATDPKWKDWVNTSVQYLVIVADLPGVIDDKAGSPDPRRQILPICRCYWDSDVKDLTVEIQKSGVHIATAPRPDQPLPAGW